MQVVFVTSSPVVTLEASFPTATIAVTPEPIISQITPSSTPIPSNTPTPELSYTQGRLTFVQKLLILHFDEPEGTINFMDSSDFGNHGSCSDPTCPTSGVVGKVNNALLFDGIDDYVNLGNPDSLNFEGEITIEAWVNPELNNSFRNIVAHGTLFDPMKEVFLRISDGRYEVGSWTGIGHKAYYSMPTGDLNNWIHLVGVYDGTAWRLYRNGIEVAQTIDPIGAVLVNSEWAIGASGYGFDRFFKGSIDEVKIYNIALTDEEIIARYKSSQLYYNGGD